MANKTITIRIDEKLKADVERACADDARTLTDVLHHGMRSYLDEYYKRKASHARFLRGQLADACYEVMLQNIQIKEGKRERMQLKQEVIDLLWELSEE